MEEMRILTMKICPEMSRKRVEKIYEILQKKRSDLRMTEPYRGIIVVFSSTFFPRFSYEEIAEIHPKAWKGCGTMSGKFKVLGRVSCLFYDEFEEIFKEIEEETGGKIYLAGLRHNENDVFFYTKN